MEEQIIYDRTIFRVIHGSKAYGTSIPGSDTDEKGIALLDDPRYYFGFSRFEQKDSGWSDGADRQIYDIRKFFRLAMSCNPNIIEMLFVDPSDHIIVSDEGRRILAARRKFLSRRAALTFSGYAFSQLKKLRARVASGKPPKHKHSMHLVRLLKMGREIVETGEVIVRRPDHERLLAIRLGHYHLDPLIKWAEKESAAVRAMLTEGKSPLPVEPDKDYLESLLISLIKEAL